MAVINKNIAYMALPLSIRRGNPFPLDEYSVWYDMDELNTYASTSPVAYVGQIVVYVDETASTTTAYMIQNAAGTLIKLASTTASGDLTEDVQELQGKVSTLEASVGTKDELSEIIATNLWAAIEEVKTAYESALEAVESDLEANYYNKTDAESKMDEKIASAISSVYKPSGSVAFESLPALTSSEEGKVYNITNAFTTTDDFVDGSGKTYPAGTNVVCIEVDGSSYKWDVLAGVTDLSAYDTADVTEGKIATAKQEAITAAASDATTKADAAKQEATEYADDLNTAMDGRVEALEGSSHTHANQTVLDLITSEKVQSWDNKVDSEEGKGLSENDFTDTLLEKLNLIEAGAQVNVLEAIKINGVAADISDKAVNIPIGGTDVLGVVKSVTTENGVSIGTDGAMSVNEINVNKLTQTDGERLVLDGGDSTDA